MISLLSETEVRIPSAGAMLGGILVIPEGAREIVLFVHGSGSSRHSPRNRFVAHTLNRFGLATLLFDLLTSQEESADAYSGEYRFDIALLATRLGSATDWVSNRPDLRDLSIGYFGSSTGGAAALVASVERPGQIAAIVCRGSRTDMASRVLPRVTCPTLLIAGERDEAVLAWNRQSLTELNCEKQIVVVPHATHLFEEFGGLERVADLAGNWFLQHS